MNSIGPCLSHCYNSKYLYLIIGIVIGLFIYKFIERKKIDK